MSQPQEWAPYLAMAVAVVLFFTLTWAMVRREGKCASKCFPEQHHMLAGDCHCGEWKR